MKNMKKFLKASLPLAAILLAGCVSDPRYDIESLDQIDESISVFNGGLEVPIGQTEVVTLGEVLKLVGSEDIDSFLQKDADGNYSISAQGDYSLDKVLADMHLEQLSDIDGASFTTDVEYEIGNIDQSQFKISGQELSYSFDGYDNLFLDDIPVPDVTSPNRVIKAELYKYLPDNTDIGAKFGSLEHTENLLEIGDISLPASLPGDTEIPVQEYISILGKSSIHFDCNKDLDESISLGASASNVADVSNFQLKSGSQLKVDLEIRNCPLTDGQVTPDIDLDISSMLVLADAVSNKLDLSGLVLSKSNSWKTSRTYTISSLASGFPQYASGKIDLKGLVTLVGDIVISNAKSTPNTVKALAGKQMSLNAKVSLDGVMLDAMDITLSQGVSYSAQNIDIPIDISYTLPEAVKSIDKVFFDQSKKITVSIDASGLGKVKSIDGSKHLSVVPDIELTFPAELEIKEAVNGKVVIKGEDLYNGSIVKQYTLVSLEPYCLNGALSYMGHVEAKVSAGASGTFSSKNLPTSESDDLTVKVGVGGQVALSDYNITLNKDKLTYRLDKGEAFSFVLEGMGDFGTFRIIPKGTPKAVLEFDLPATSETELLADNLVITIPEMLEVDGSGVRGYDASTNTITINGKLPSGFELPIKSLVVAPKTDSEGRTVVFGAFSVKGEVSISETHITRKTLVEINGRKAGVKAIIPDMEAGSIVLEGDFNKSLDYEAKDIVILDSKAMASVPKEVKSLEDVTLDNVNAIIEVKVTGLPDMQGKFIMKGTRIQLPPFLFGENGSNVLVLDDEIEISEGKEIVRTAKLSKLKNVQLAGVKEITGDIKFESSLYSQKPTVDLSTLKGKFKATVRIGVGNGTSADAPGKIAISKAVVKVGYDIEESQSISFKDVPAEFKGDNFSLSVNPEMHLELSTNFGAPVSGGLVLTPYIGGKAQSPVTIDNIELPCSDDWNTTKVNKYAIGAKATVARDEIHIATDLSSLLKCIPDEIEVAIKANVDENKECTIFPAAAYTCGMKYLFKVPLSFGKDCHLSRTADLEVDGSINEFLKMADGFSLSGSYRTTLPIGVQVEVALLDNNDRIVPLKGPVKFTLDKSTDGKTEKEGDFSIDLLFDTETVNVKTIRFNINIDASPDVNLNENQYLQLTRLKAVVPEGLNVIDSE